MTRAFVIILIAALLIGTWFFGTDPRAVDAGTTYDSSTTTEESLELASWTKTGSGESTEDPVDGSRRRTIPHRLRVLAAESGQAIQGSAVYLFNARDDVVGEAITDAEGYAAIPRGVQYLGYAATAPGFQTAAADSDETAIYLARTGSIAVRVRGAASELMAGYRLQASLEHGEQRYPTEFARRASAMTAGPRVWLTNDQCRLTRILDAPGLVRLYGVHRATGTVTEFDKHEVAPDQTQVEFDCRGYATPTGNWLRIEIQPPRIDSGPASLSASLWYQNADVWMPWSRSGAQLGKNGEPIHLDFVELAERIYRVRIEIFGEQHRQLLIPPFLIKGGKTKRVDLRINGLASLTVNIRGTGIYSSECVRLEGPKGASPVIAQHVAQNIFRFHVPDAGAYRVCPGYWGTFAEAEVNLTAGQRAVVDVTPVPMGVLELRGLDRGAWFKVIDTDRNRSVPDKTFLWGKLNECYLGRIPYGPYQVEIPGHPTMQVVVGDRTSSLDCKTGLIK